MGAPGARFNSSAVWTGSKMVVFGGYDGSYLNTGGVYNPGLNSWTTTTTTGAPSTRYTHSAVWTGSKMIIWGGQNASELDTGAIYD